MVIQLLWSHADVQISPPACRVGTASDEGVVDTVRTIMQSGAAGVFFGRNIFQSDNMPELLLHIRSALADKASVQGK